MLRVRKYLIWLAVLLLCAGCIPPDAAAETAVAYDDLPPSHRTLYETAMAKALEEAQSRAPAKLLVQARGDFHGYTDTKADNSLQVDYRVSDSIVKVGEKIKFYVNVSCEYPPMIYTVSGLVFDESFNKTGTLNSTGSSVMVEDAFKAVTYSYTPTVPGYVNFVFAVSDGNENQVYVITSTVMVCEEDDPIFSNSSVDIDSDTSSSLGLMLNLDRASVTVGKVITATADVTTTADPVSYRGVWTLTDADGSILDAAESTGTVNAQAEQARLTFEYRPLQTGKLQFVINASDGEDNRIKTNTPVISVEDGYYFTAGLNRNSALTVGGTLIASYEICGHTCDDAVYEIGWTCYDADGKVAASQTQTVQARSGKAQYAPRIGQEVVFHVGASCGHFPDAEPATAGLVLVGGLEGEVSLTKSSVASGEEIGVTYAFTGGLEPYQKITVRGYVSGTDGSECFLEQVLTEAEGTVNGIPATGSEAYFVVELVESDGYTTTWRTEKAVITAAEALMGDADANGVVNAQDVLRIMQYDAGWSVALNTVNADVNGSGSVSMEDAVQLLRMLAGQ